MPTTWIAYIKHFKTKELPVYGLEPMLCIIKYYSIVPLLLESQINSKVVGKDKQD